VGKLTVSRRYNLLPLLRSHPGGVCRELAVQDLPVCVKERFARKRVQRYKKEVKKETQKKKTFLILTNFYCKGRFMCGKMRKFAAD